MNEKLKTKIILAITILLILLNILIILNKVIFPEWSNQKIIAQYEDNINNNNTNNIEENSVNEKTKEELEQEELEELKIMSEQQRIKYYLSKYIGYIEKQDYKSAYDLLYDDFKQNYFKTLEEYTAYIEKEYPKLMDIKYSEVQTQGYYYILYITIQDLLNFSEEEISKEQRFVIYENDFNDFVISFNV